MLILCKSIRVEEPLHSLGHDRHGRCDESSLLPFGKMEQSGNAILQYHPHCVEARGYGGLVVIRVSTVDFCWFSC